MIERLSELGRTATKLIRARSTPEVQIPATVIFGVEGSVSLTGEQITLGVGTKASIIVGHVYPNSPVITREYAKEIYLTEETVVVQNGQPSKVRGGWIVPYALDSGTRKEAQEKGLDDEVTREDRRLAKRIIRQHGGIRALFSPISRRISERDVRDVEIKVLYPQRQEAFKIEINLQA